MYVPHAHDRGRDVCWLVNIEFRREVLTRIFVCGIIESKEDESIMSKIAIMCNYEITKTNLTTREAILDEAFLSNPVVVAQRIQREYVKLCLKNPQILLPSTLIL